MKKTSDIWLAGYLRRLGHKVIAIDKSGRRASWSFEIDGDQWQALLLGFLESPESQIKYVHEQLKDLVYQ